MPRKYRLHLTWKVYCVILLKLFYSQLCNHYLQWGKKKMEIRRGNLLHGKRKRTKQLLQQKPIPAIEFQISKEFLWISLIGSKIPRPRGWKLKSQLGHKSRYWCACMPSHFIRVWLCVTLGTVAHQASQSKGFFRQDYWSGLPCLLPDDLLNPGIKPGLLSLLHWQVGSLPLAPPGAKSGDKLIRYVNSKLEWNASVSLNFFRKFSLVQFSRSFVSDFATSWTAACQASLAITNSWSPSKPMSIESVMPSNHLILCHPLLLLPSIFPSIRVFSNESALCIKWPKY